MIFRWSGFQVEYLLRNHLVILQDQEQIDPFEHLEYPAHGGGLGRLAGLGTDRSIFNFQSQA